ncbi:MAG TPA: hypothetical protein VFJ30_03815 [Phycisphaerae bacterium]|nr:hypothetical protein [Phycisphaerae bacterium]
MKPQDILVALKIQSLNEKTADGAAVWPQRLLAEETGLSLSEVNAACRRLQEVGLLSPERRKVVRSALLEFLVHGLKYVFPVALGRSSRGMPTGYAAAPLRELFLTSAEEMPPVWPDADGAVRGMALKPLYRSVPMAAKKDVTLYEYLVLIDAIRGGRARERKAATEILQKRLG